MPGQRICAVLLFAVLSAAQSAPPALPASGSTVPPETVSPSTAPSENTDSPPAPPAEPAPDSSSSENFQLTLADGEAVMLRTARRLSSEEEKDGEEVAFEVTKPVKAGDLVVIAQGATAYGRVLNAKKKRRRGIPGKLEISVERVRLVTGALAPLRAVQGGKGESHSTDIALDMTELTLQTYGLGLPLAPLFLLEHGEAVVLPSGFRVTAFVDGDMILERESVLMAQPPAESNRADVAIVFVYRTAKDKLQNVSEPVTCGDVEIGSFRPGQFVRIELPPGQYWLRAGGAKTNAFGMRSLRGEYLPLNVEGGATYYVRMQINGKMTWRPQLREITGEEGKSEIDIMDSFAEKRISDSSLTTNLSKLQALPKLPVPEEDTPPQSPQ